MRNLLTICALLLASSGFGQTSFDEALDDLSKKLALRITPLEKHHIAVSDLVTLKGDSTALGMMAAEELTIGLVHHALGFEVMDRAHLRAIFDEHKLAMGGLLSEEGLIELGKLESVDVVVTGTITALPDRYKITVKALDTETAGVIAAERTYCLREAWLDALFGIDSPVRPPAKPADPIDPKPIKPTLPCDVSGTGQIQFTNQRGDDLTVQISCEGSSGSCEPKQKLVVRSGTTQKSAPVCSGIVHYALFDSYGKSVGKGGTLYLSPCDVKPVTFSP